MKVKQLTQELKSLKQKEQEIAEGTNPWQGLGFSVRSDALWPAKMFESVNPAEYQEFTSWLADYRDSLQKPKSGKKCLLVMVNRTADDILVFYGLAKYAGETSSHYQLTIDSGTHDYSKNNQLVFASQKDFEHFKTLLATKFGDKHIEFQKMPVMETKLNVAEAERFSEPLSGYRIVYRKSSYPVTNTPSFDTREQAQKYLMNKMRANHQDLKVTAFSDRLKETFSFNKQTNKTKKTKIQEGLSWDALDQGLSLEDKLIIFEEYSVKGNLTESNDRKTQEYFQSLFDMSSPPVKNQKYIVVPVMLVRNQIMKLDKPSFMEYLGRGRDGLVFRSSTGQKTYPARQVREISVVMTFTFETSHKYDKFRTILSLKFNTELPKMKLSEIKKSVAETAYAKDLDEKKPVKVSGVKGMKSTPFTKKFRNLEAYRNWSESDEAGNYEVHQVTNEGTGEDVKEGYWADAVSAAEKSRAKRAGKPFEKNPASHDEKGIYKGDLDLAGRPVPKRKEPGVTEAADVLSGVKLYNAIVRILKATPGLKFSSKESDAGSFKAWYGRLDKIDLTTLIQQLKSIDPMVKFIKASAEEPWSIRGKNFRLDGPDQNYRGDSGLFLEVYRAGPGGKLRRAGSDEPIAEGNKDSHDRIQELKNYIRIKERVLAGGNALSPGEQKYLAQARQELKQLKKQGVAEGSEKLTSNWKSWDLDNYELGSPEYYSSLSNAILSLVKEKFGGKAWFDGGGYAYLIDVSSPKKLVSSDGAAINVPNVARGLEKYTNNFKENFVDVYPSDWPDFFLSPRKRPGPESDQEWYELGKMGIDVRENSYKLSKQAVAEGLPGSLSKSDYTLGKTVTHQDTNCTSCHGRKSMYKLGGKLFADNKKGAVKVKCPVCKGTGDKQGVVEHVDIDAIHAEALREHLVTNPKLYENQQDVTEIRKFLKLHATPTPRVDKEYVYASVQVIPFANFINIAHFNNQHKLVKLGNEKAYFDVNGTIKRFPISGKLSGDALSEIYFFNSEKEFQEFNTMLSLKYSNHKITHKNLDDQGVAEAASAQSIDYAVWSQKSPEDQARLLKDYPNLKIKNKPRERPETASQPKKLTLADVWRKVETVVAQVYPDGDPIDWLTPWFAKHGIRDYKVGEILDRAARKHGYTSIYQYYDSMGELHGDQEFMTENSDYVARETTNGIWRIFQTGNPVAVAGPFRSQDEMRAWFRDQKMKRGGADIESMTDAEIKQAIADIEAQPYSKDLEQRHADLASEWRSRHKIPKDYYSTSEIGRAVAESDMSGLMHAAKYLDNSYIITAKTAEGITKKYRVRAQSESSARKKFQQHYSLAEITDVKQENENN